MAMRADRSGAGRARGGALAVLLVAGAVAGCAVPGEADVDQADASAVALEVDVKRALLGSDIVGGAAIGVEVDGTGTVTLGGFVESETERDAALRLAREALGGRAAVVDEMEVR